MPCARDLRRSRHSLNSLADTLSPLISIVAMPLSRLTGGKPAPRHDIAAAVSLCSPQTVLGVHRPSIGESSLRYCENSPRQPENTDRCSARDCLVAHRAEPESVPVSCVSADFPRCWAPRAPPGPARAGCIFVQRSSDCGQGRGISKSENKLRSFFWFYFLSAQGYPCSVKRSSQQHSPFPLTGSQSVFSR